jgi:hypothetical protein
VTTQITTTPATGQTFWSSVPMIGPDEATGRPMPARRTLATQRRTLLKAAGVLGGALALNVLSWLPPARVRGAAARVGTEYLGCAGYDQWPGYNDNTAICVGAPYSPYNCGTDGWFLQYSGTCFVSGAVVDCGIENGLTAKNAWRWNYSGHTYRCSDGMQYWCGGSAFVICDYQLS